ncbi:CaiB/BaiF CoA-transferase family protein [Caulobacter sp. S45]|uniref:CaiB/BaiF CoA transferase family protein n=1 Tax=Caulobacter sp. S45 TaxID=1641861 RepID=UPI00131B087E|nr:CoA transferase [Caulobacter sp. S45]
MKPLSGCRVLDLGIITAGAATSALLADFGAEVIKVESPTYRDPFRRWLSERPADADPSLSPFFRATNRNKLGLSLNLKHELGRNAFLRLVEKSDVVVENFRRGVLQKLGLDFETLRAANPNIILASISSQGETGPEAGYVSYGSTLEAVGGLAWTTGYEDGWPTLSGVDLNYPDQIVALFASSMIMTAWLGRDERDAGVHLDLSQRELTSYLSGEAFVAVGAGLAAGPEGNAQAPYVLQDCFLSADGAWVAVSVRNSDISRLGPLVSATEEHGLARALGEWMRTHAASRAVELLAAEGVAAAEALDGSAVLERRGEIWDQALQRSPEGALVKGFPVQFDDCPLAITREAPSNAADSEDVLQRVGGFTRAEIDVLLSAGVVEVAPAALSRVS